MATDGAVQASIAANTFVISGTNQTRSTRPDPVTVNHTGELGGLATPLLIVLRAISCPAALHSRVKSCIVATVSIMVESDPRMLQCSHGYSLHACSPADLLLYPCMLCDPSCAGNVGPSAQLWGCAAELPDMMPGILQQMGADNLQSLRKLAEQLPPEARNAIPSPAATAEDDDEGA